MNKEIPADSLIVVGKVLAPWGVKGEVKVEAISDSPGRFSAGGILYANDRPMRVLHSTGLAGGHVALQLENVTSRDAAQELRGVFLLVPEDAAPPLPDGKYYHFQIIGMEVYTLEKENLGRVTEILATGSNDVYVVTSEREELLVPALDEVVKEVDVARRTITVDLPDGLRSSSRASKG